MSDKTRKASADKINLVSNRDAEAEELHEVIDRGAFTLRRQAAGQEAALLVEFASGRCRGFSYSYFMDADQTGACYSSTSRIVRFASPGVISTRS